LLSPTPPGAARSLVIALMREFTIHAQSAPQEAAMKKETETLNLNMM
jgi:hypothetical protein